MLITWKNSLLAATSLVILTPALGNVTAPTQPLELPAFLPSYQPPPPPAKNSQFVIKKKYAWLKGFYFSGRFQYDFNKVGSIEVVDPLPGQPTSAQKEFNKGTAGGGAAIGYQFKPSGLFSRVEVEYIYRSNIDNTINPLYQFPANIQTPPTSQLETTIHNQTLLAKIYYDINTNSMVMPYVQVGAGMAFNHVKANSQVNLPLPIQSTPVKLESTQSTNNFAWDVGAGVRFVFNEYVSAAVGYQFTSLGKLKWQTTTFDPTKPINFESKSFYANGITLDLMLHV